MDELGRSPSRRGPRRAGPHPDISPRAREIARAWQEEWDALTPEEQEQRNADLYRAIREADDPTAPARSSSSDGVSDVRPKL